MSINSGSNVSSVVHCRREEKMMVEGKATRRYHWRIMKHVISERKRASLLRVDWHRATEVLFFDQL